GDVIKRYFVEFPRLSNDLTVRLGTGVVEVHGRPADDWVVDLVDTGLETSTGGRVKRLQSALAGITFLLTYGDGVRDLDLGSRGCWSRSGRRATRVGRSGRERVLAGPSDVRHGRDGTRRHLARQAAGGGRGGRRGPRARLGPAVGARPLGDARARAGRARER